ncbi:hypothetical protein MMC28_007859 [Mycoblastus sanguinarius]|nr:hypothetical protein [Mycoblastus sanguinarius]
MNPKRLQWSSPFDAEAEANLDKAWRDGIGVDVLPELLELKWSDGDMDENLRKDIDLTMTRVQRQLADLDDILDTTPGQWLESLCDDFYNVYMRSLTHRPAHPYERPTDSKEQTALLVRKIRQDLVRLEDIPTYHTEIGFQLKKGELRIDLRTTLSALLMVQNESGWKWSNGHQFSNQPQGYRPMIQIDTTKHVITFQRSACGQPLRPFNSRGLVLMLAARDIECMSCISEGLDASQMTELEDSYKVCNDCIQRLYMLSTMDLRLMPPMSPTGDIIPLKLVEKLFDRDFKQRWNRRCREAKTKNRCYCPLESCGHWIEPDHIRYFIGDSDGTRWWQAFCPTCENDVYVPIKRISRTPIDAPQFIIK